jgi:hypothetical protein
VLQKQHAERGFRDILERPRFGDEDTEQCHPDSGGRRFGVLLRGMPRGDVTDFVSEHAGELRLVVKEGKNAARQVDVAPGQRERIHRGCVDDGEVPGKIRPL